MVHDGGTPTLPTISVIMGVNRHDRHLKAAIESVLRQTRSDFEFLIGANDCPDSLIEWLEELCGGDSRVTIHRTAIPQLGFTLNHLAGLSSGEYVIRMDADDVCLPERFAVLSEAVRDTRPDVVGSWAIIIDENDREIGRFNPPMHHRNIVRRMMIGTAIYHPTVAIRRDFLLAMRGYAGGLASEDADLWLRAIRAGARFANVPHYLLRYRVHSQQASRSRLGYAEAAGHWLRELCLSPSFFTFGGFAVALGKVVLRSVGVIRPMASQRRS